MIPGTRFIGFLETSEILSIHVIWWVPLSDWRKIKMVKRWGWIICDHFHLSVAGQVYITICVQLEVISENAQFHKNSVYHTAIKSQGN